VIIYSHRNAAIIISQHSNYRKIHSSSPPAFIQKSNAFDIVNDINKIADLRAGYILSAVTQ